MEGLLQIGDGSTLRQPLHRLDGRATRLHSESQAGMHDAAVEKHEARTTDAHLATGMGAGEFERLAQEIGERRSRRDAMRDLAAIHRHGHINKIAHGTCLAISPSNRPSNTRARWRRMAGGTFSSSGGSRSWTTASWAAAMAS